MADSVLKVFQESRVTSQILLKNEYILCASKPSANMKKCFKSAYTVVKIAAKFSISLCMNAFVESLPLNICECRQYKSQISAYRHYWKMVSIYWPHSRSEKWY